MDKNCHSKGTSSGWKLTLETISVLKYQHYIENRATCDDEESFWVQHYIENQATCDDEESFWVQHYIENQATCDDEESFWVQHYIENRATCDDEESFWVGVGRIIGRIISDLKSFRNF
jgi:hypothetical protein